MLRFAANLTMMYTELPFLERFAAASADGFHAVEFLFPYEWPSEVLAEQLQVNGLEQVLFNAPPGNWANGERGIASLPGRETEFRQSVDLALSYAQTLGCSRVHVMAGIVPPGSSTGERWDKYQENLAWAADRAAKLHINVLMEPINGRDMPGYLLQRLESAHAMMEALGRGNLKMQMDLYHCQIAQGDVIMRLREYLGNGSGKVAHLQIAGVPERHEPDEGELYYKRIFQELESLGYDGWIGCEYRPRAGTSEGLRWLRAHQAQG
jgi:hydroxypyruvate isomerase